MQTSDKHVPFIQHSLNMLTLTRVRLINTFWQHGHEIAQTGRLAFIIRGNSVWESESTDGISHDNRLWLKSNRYDENGKSIFQDPVRLYLQLQMNSYETWGTINVSLNPLKVDESKQIIEGAINTIGLAINGMSFLFGASLHWIPARYIRISRISDRSIPVEPVETKDWICLPLPKSQDDHSSVVLKDDHIKNLLFPFIHQVANIPAHIRPTIETALDWHAHANRFASGLNRFVNYWASMELLGNFWNVQLSKKRVLKELKLEIYEKLRFATEDNCLKLVRECKEMDEPPIKTKLKALLDTVVIDTQKRELLPV